MIDKSVSQGPSEVAILAGGCFWGVQGVFQHVKGVSNAVSGYAGGEKETLATIRSDRARPVTPRPCGLRLIRARSVTASCCRSTFRLRMIRRNSTVKVRMSAQYRSPIFPTNGEQARVAKAYIAQLNQAHAFNAAIVTQIETGRTFYPAEAYHQDFLTRYPTYPYIVINDLPKVESVKRLYPALFRDEPVLVANAGLSN